MDVNNSTLSNETLRNKYAAAPGLSPHTRIALYSTLLVWPLLGNVLVIAVVFCNQNLRTNMNYLVVNMAVSDLLISLVAVPWMISRSMVRYKEWLVDGPFGHALCKLVPFLSDISPSVSSISLVTIAFQRYIAVVYPNRSGQILTPKTRYIFICFPWIIAMALFSPYFYVSRLINEKEYTMCDYSWSPAFEYWTAQTIFISINTIVSFVIPLIAIIILYTLIHYSLRKSLNNVMELLQRETIRLRQRKNRRIFSMAITIIVMVTVFWTPLTVFHFLMLFRHPAIESMDTYSKLFFPFIYLWHVLPAINPCVYFLFLKDFRQGLKTLCCSKPNGQISTLCVCCANTVAPSDASIQVHQQRQNRTPCGDSNQNPTCTPPHINTTSV